MPFLIKSINYIRKWEAFHTAHMGHPPSIWPLDFMILPYKSCMSKYQCHGIYFQVFHSLQTKYFILKRQHAWLDDTYSRPHRWYTSIYFVIKFHYLYIHGKCFNLITRLSKYSLKPYLLCFSCELIFSLKDCHRHM